MSFWNCAKYHCRDFGRNLLLDFVRRPALAQSRRKIGQLRRIAPRRLALPGHRAHGDERRHDPCLVAHQRLPKPFGFFFAEAGVRLVARLRGSGTVMFRARLGRLPAQFCLPARNSRRSGCCRRCARCFSARRPKLRARGARWARDRQTSFPAFSIRRRSRSSSRDPDATSTLMKSAPLLFKSRTAARPSSGRKRSRAARADLICRRPTSAPGNKCAGQSAFPASISLRQPCNAARSPPMSRTVVTPLAIRSGRRVALLHFGSAVTPARCTCMSHRPGMRNFPRPSITRTPSGGADWVMLAMRSPEMSTVRSGCGAAPVAIDHCHVSEGERVGLRPGSGGEDE